MLAGGGIIKDVPKLPKAAPQTPQSGMSVVSNPAPAQGGGGAQAVAATNYDKEWATVSGVIPANDVKAAFLKVQNELNQKLQAQGMPNIQLTTDILKIELQRQRGSMGPNGPLFPNGENGVETVPLPQYLQNIVQPLPDAKAGLAEKVNYYDWAEKNAELVSQPKFYDIHGGTPWVAPTLAGAAPAGAANAPAPPPNAPKPLAGIPPVLPPRVVAPAQPNPALGAAGAGGNKNQGAIAPENLNQDILVWAHDDTVQPGAVYRYRIIYYMKNPVMGQKNIADQSIIDTLAVKSPPSDWSAPVTIPQVTEFWFARAANNGAAADIYHWENGGWTRKQNVPINPGDRVADSEWTVIDVHGGNREREKYVILTNDNGEVVRRFPNSDRTSDRKKALDAQVNPAPAAAAGPGGGTAPHPAPPPRTPSVAPGQRAGVLPRGGG